MIGIVINYLHCSFYATYPIYNRSLQEQVVSVTLSHI